MLLVQEKWGISGPPSSSLQCGFRFMKCLGLCLKELSTCLPVGRPRSVVNWKMVQICIFLCVWKEINLRCFKNLKSFMKDILTSFFHTLYLWTIAFLSPLSLSFVDFIVRFSLPS
jgi:hypothetical protein